MDDKWGTSIYGNPQVKQTWNWIQLEFSDMEQSLIVTSMDLSGI